MADIDFGTGPNTPTGDTIQQALVKLQTRAKLLDGGSMPDIDFGTGPNTPTGDTIQQALVKLQTRIAALEAGGSNSGAALTIDPIVSRSGNVYTFTARRTTSLSSAETRMFKIAGSTSYPPAANANDFEASFPTATASFAAGNATAQFQVASPVAQPE